MLRRSIHIFSYILIVDWSQQLFEGSERSRINQHSHEVLHRINLDPWIRRIQDLMEINWSPHSESDQQSFQLESPYLYLFCGSEGSQSSLKQEVLHVLLHLQQKMTNIFNSHLESYDYSNLFHLWGVNIEPFDGSMDLCARKWQQPMEHLPLITLSSSSWTFFLNCNHHVIHSSSWDMSDSLWIAFSFAWSGSRQHLYNAQ